MDLSIPQTIDGVIFIPDKTTPLHTLPDWVKKGGYIHAGAQKWAVVDDETGAIRWEGAIDHKYFNKVFAPLGVKRPPEIDHCICGKCPIGQNYYIIDPRVLDNHPNAVWVPFVVGSTCTNKIRKCAMCKMDVVKGTRKCHNGVLDLNCRPCRDVNDVKQAKLDKFGSTAPAPKFGKYKDMRHNTFGIWCARSPDWRWLGWSLFQATFIPDWVDKYKNNCLEFIQDRYPKGYAELMAMSG